MPSMSSPFGNPAEGVAILATFASASFHHGGIVVLSAGPESTSAESPLGCASAC